MIIELISRALGIHKVGRIVKRLGEPIEVDVNFRAKNVYIPAMLEVSSEIIHSKNKNVSLRSSKTVFVTKNGDYKCTIVLDTNRLRQKLEGNYDLKIKISGFGKVYFERVFSNAVELYSVQPTVTAKQQVTRQQVTTTAVPTTTRMVTTQQQPTRVTDKRQPTTTRVATQQRQQVTRQPTTTRTTKQQARVTTQQRQPTTARTTQQKQARTTRQQTKTRRVTTQRQQTTTATRR